MKKKHSLVIAEDQKLFKDAIIPLLECYDINTIATAENGLELISKLKKGIQCDAVLMDIEMPFLNGGETLDILQKDFPDLNIIILSQYGEYELALNFLKRGAKGFFSKGDDIEVIANGIKEIIKEGTCKKNLDYLKPNGLKNAFTKRQIEIITKICQGKTNKEIAFELNIGLKTVEAHKKRVYAKVNKVSTSSFMEYALNNGLNYLK